MTIALIKQLATRVKDVSVVVECYYAGDAREVAAKANALWRKHPAEIRAFIHLEVRTVNSYIGQEAGIIIFVTGRTSGHEIAQDFVLQPRLATVAVS